MDARQHLGSIGETQQCPSLRVPPKAGRSNLLWSMRDCFASLAMAVNRRLFHFVRNKTKQQYHSKRKRRSRGIRKEDKLKEPDFIFKPRKFYAEEKSFDNGSGRTGFS